MEYKNKSILVTGGCGFIGSWLTEELAKLKPRSLIVVDNLFAGNRENLSVAKKLMPSLKICVEDASDYNIMRDIMVAEKTDIVFALATVCLPYSLENPFWASRAIYNLALCMCQLVKELKPERLIHISSSEVHGTARYLPMDEAHPLRPETPYAAAKAGSDLLVRSYQRTFGIDAMIIRPFNTYGPRQGIGEYCGIVPSVLKCIMRGQTPVIFGDGKQSRDWTYVYDIVKGILAAASCDGLRNGIVNVGSGISTSVNELVALLCEMTGCVGNPRYAPARRGDVAAHRADFSRLYKATGYVPLVSLEEGLKTTCEWYQSQYGET